MNNVVIIFNDHQWLASLTSRDNSYSRSKRLNTETLGETILKGLI